MASSYPNALDTLATTKADATVMATDHPAHHNNLADAVNKIEAELGVSPKGSAATVAAAVAALIPLTQKGAVNGVASLAATGRVPIAQLASGAADGTKFVRDDGTLAAVTGGGAVVDASTTAKGIVQLAGDLAGIATAPTVGDGKVTEVKLAPAVATKLNAVAGSTIATTTPTSSTSAALSDDFNDNVLDTAKWPNSAGASEVGGRARLPCATSYNNYASASTYSMAGASVSVQSVTRPSAGAGTTQAYLEFSNASGSAAILWGNGELSFQETVAGQAQTAVNITFDATAHAYWQIRESGGSLYWETSPTGAAGTWVIRRQKVAAITFANSKFLFASGYYGAENAGTVGVAEFDNFAAVTPSNAGLGLANAGTIVEVTASTATPLLVPTDASVAFLIGTWIEVYQAGTGPVTITPADSSVLIRERENKLKVAGQYGVVGLRKRATNEWSLTGDVAPV